MTDMILRLFVKGYKSAADTSDPAVRRKCGAFAGVFGIAANFFLFALKIILGTLSGSIAITADAFNNFSDAGSSLMTLVGFRMSGKPADKDHPYGHARLEYLFGLFVSIAVLVLGVEFLKSSVEKLLAGGEETVFTVTTTVILALSVLIKVLMALFYRSVGKRINSEALTAAAADSVSDVITTSVIVVGTVISRFTGPYTDGVLGVAVGLYIIILGIKLVKETSDPLLGSAPDAAQIKMISNRIKSFDPNVLGIHDLVIHNYGTGKTFASVHVEVDAHRDIMESHDMVDNIESDFLKNLGIELVIHIDPIHYDDEHLNALRRDIQKIVADLSVQYGCQLSMHDLRMVIGVTHTNVLFDIALPSDCGNIDESELCEKLGEHVRMIDPTYNTIVTVDRDYTCARYEEDSDVEKH